MWKQYHRLAVCSKNHSTKAGEDLRDYRKPYGERLALILAPLKSEGTDIADHPRCDGVRDQDRLDGSRDERTAELRSVARGRLSSVRWIGCVPHGSHGSLPVRRIMVFGNHMFVELQTAAS
jgi:hypothetical protein